MALSLFEYSSKSGYMTYFCMKPQLLHCMGAVIVQIYRLLVRGKIPMLTKHCFHEPCNHNSLKGCIWVGLVLPGVSFWFCLFVQEWNAEQQFHLLIATLHLGNRH